MIAEFEQINGGWAWETIVLDNNFVFSNSEKYILSIGVGKFVGLHVFVFIHPA